ncbi:pyocin knob domain-containing protein [Lentilactobacillus parabuchneri]|uniref:pyocin knob domain-containing protein n=1 Tax=Lentilactobacillus parabuchneri TaxID=152331 RepID=UPI000A0FE4AF|nr:pyocin knob domain-containing protein [Lentilactobacillus parabuchneri]ORM91198.1 hypothetical protein FAM21809_01948 [Lentilactobacillus parabuchneri]ORN13733.1 hypothetical protein FAM23164_01919 [Lentilactobacillus parabuchneri]ORN15496.1 hypothetical protein FAM23165_01959 [Lentilactobacillus parabuchneri]ORN19064.1 hypothetical protein FAM23166_01881 [Lentilactobacillus parabuchneri]ORN24515.1 hypothetical protein FAM23167_01893 [Lentilactobacillus parabuchneri]
MSKELAFTDDNDVVKYLDTTTAFNLALTADGVAFDLTNAKSILVKIANDDGYIMQQTIDLTTVTSPLGGTLSFPINQDIMNTLVPDDYDIEVWLTMKDGTQAIFPSDGTLGFSIEENLMSDTGEVIPTITLNDFQQQFDDLSSQMENAVHNVHKGDQGNPGNGIKSANNQYQLSDSPVTVPTGGWSDTILATTDQLPYLWTKIIFTYDDGTTKEINFVSSRGDTGSQGPIGPVGPQGKQGNGLVVRGKADKEENLPTTGNNQGDGYLVGTDLYIWIDDSWQNMGSITPDLADYVKVTDMNNALSTKANTEDVNQQLDKKVNVADMRKPASDVVGMEDVSTSVYKGSLAENTDLNTLTQEGIYNFYGTSFVNFIDSNNHWGTIQIINKSDMVAQLVICTGNISDQIFFRTQSGSPETWLPWTMVPRFGMDNSLVLPNGERFKPADDSKVAHLSGANNFDTVPTVNNNPLLLASSLPSDLARTGQDTNFTRKLQKSGIDVATTADVSKAVNTATSNVVTTDKPANFTAGLQVNGKDVGTGGGDKLTTPWVVTNYQSTDTMGPHGCNEATGWRIYNDILYYYGYFYGATVSEAVIFNLYTAYPDFKKTFKTLGSSPELMHQTSSGFWAFNDWGNQMVGNEGNLLIGIKDTATPLSVNIVYPLDRL